MDEDEDEDEVVSAKSASSWFACACNNEERRELAGLAKLILPVETSAGTK